MSKRWIEFFQGEKDMLSMMRLMVFASFFPASYVVCYLKSTESLAVYLGAYVGGVVGGKVAEGKYRSKTNATKYNKSDS